MVPQEEGDGQIAQEVSPLGWGGGVFLGGNYFSSALGKIKMCNITKQSREKLNRSVFFKEHFGLSGVFFGAFLFFLINLLE